MPSVSVREIASSSMSWSSLPWWSRLLVSSVVRRMVVGGWWSVVGGRWSVVGGRWSLVGGRSSAAGGRADRAQGR
ncbi:hypothetical protein C1N91_06810 [Curtobacterium sp. SGAir0471]|nr:hypothetical protein C1N91_06810 [Curtobacterium sp. SGAir0471]